MISLMKVRCSGLSILAVWGLVVGSGLFFLESYSFRPGDSGSPPVMWPTASRVRPHSGRSNLLIFLHPQCPCSRASVDELRTILRAMRNSGVSPCSVLATRRWRCPVGRFGARGRAGKMPDVEIYYDAGGLESPAIRGGHVRTCSAL